MKKYLLTLLFVCSAICSVNAGFVSPGTHWSVIVSSVNVYGEASIVYSDPIDLTNYKAFGYEFIVWGSSHNAVDVKVEYQVCHYNGGNMTVAQSTGTSTGDLKPVWTVPTTGGTVDASITSTTNIDGYQVDAFVPMATRYIRFKITGNSGCDKKSYVSMYFCGYSEK